MSIFIDQYGNKFVWKVNCISKAIENKEVKCVHCYGSGKIENLDSYYSNINCDWCSGSGKRTLQVKCYDNDLEKYLEKFIDQYYNEKKQRETNSFLGENI